MIRFLYAEGKIGWPESNNHGDTSLASRTLKFDRLAPVPRQFNVSRKPPCTPSVFNCGAASVEHPTPQT
jgi:hypothetical protein